MRTVPSKEAPAIWYVDNVLGAAVTARISFLNPIKRAISVVAALVSERGSIRDMLADAVPAARRFRDESAVRQVSALSRCGVCVVIVLEVVRSIVRSVRSREVV